MSALPGWWRWMPGMLLIDGSRVVRAHPNPAVFNLRAVHPDGTPSMLTVPIRAVEDDPATIGCLTARVREVCNDPTVTATCRRCLHIRGDAASGWEDGPWSVTVSSSSVTIEIASGPTEWSALMAAGDAAWARRGGAS